MKTNKSQFYNTIIYSDFNIIEKKNKSNIILTLSTKLFINILNIFFVIKNVKQILKILFFLKKNKNIKKKLCLFLPNKNMNFFFKSLISQKYFSKFSLILNKDKLKKKVGAIIIINKKKNDNLVLYKNLLNKKLFLFINISSAIDNIEGSYIIYNEIDNYKKALYFFIILNKFIK